METVCVLYRVPQLFHAYVDACLVRLGYLFPALEFSFDGDSISATGQAKSVSANIREEIAHTLYREKIYADTLSIRAAVYAAMHRR